MPLGHTFEELQCKSLMECLMQLQDVLPPDFFQRYLPKALRKAQEIHVQVQFLTVNECTILVLYTMEGNPRESGFYFQMNAALREPSRARVPKWKDTIFLLLAAMGKLPQPT